MEAILFAPCVHTVDGDTLLFFDFRADRMRQIVEAFGIKPQFDVETVLKDLVSCHSDYSEYH